MQNNSVHTTTIHPGAGQGGQSIQHRQRNDSVAAAEQSRAVSCMSARTKSFGRRLSWSLLALVLMCASAQAQTISTFAGGFTGDGGQASSGAMNHPNSMAIDSFGNIYITDQSEHRVRKVDSSGIITTFAGTGSPGFSGDGGAATGAQLNAPTRVAVDTDDNVYIADGANYRIRKVDTNGIITTLAGSGTRGFSGDGGPATSAELGFVQGVATDTSGNVYFADQENHCIHKVDTHGIITRFAGTGTAGFFGDGGAATSAELDYPDGVTIDRYGNVYIADAYNNRIRKVNTSGTIATIAGDGTGAYSGDGGPAIDAALSYPAEVAVDSDGNLYIADADNSRIRKVDTNGIITTFAGTGSPGFSGDGGPAIVAKIRYSFGVTVDSHDNVLIADSYNHVIRKVTTDGIIDTIAGSSSYPNDGGAATSANLYGPQGMVADSTGNVYIADAMNARIRKVDTSGKITTFAGNGTVGISADGDGGEATDAELGRPLGVAVDSAGNMYIADQYAHRIRKVDMSGVITTFAGNGTRGFSGDGGPATAAQLYGPTGVAVDSIDNLYIAENRRIRKVDTDGIITTFAGNGTYEYSGDGGPATSAGLGPVAVAIDAAGNAYIADASNNRIRTVDTSGIITTFAGIGTEGFSGDGGLATSAEFGRLGGVTVDAIGNVYIADSYNHRVRKVNVNGVITTFAGNGSAGNFGDGGPATNAQLNGPAGVMVDSAGYLYIADRNNGLVRTLDVDEIFLDGFE